MYIFPQSYRSFLIQRLINHVAIDLSVWRGIANTSPRNRVINSSYTTSLHRDAAQRYYDRAQQFYGNFNIIIRFLTHWNIDWVYFRIYMYKRDRIDLSMKISVNHSSTYTLTALECLSVHLSICLSVCHCLHVSIGPSVCLLIPCLFICNLKKNEF